VIIGVILTSLTARKKKLCGYIAFLCILLINVLIIITAIAIFRSQSPLVISDSFFSLPAIGANLSINIDKLGMIFLILIGFISLIATLYSIDYMGIYKGENLIRFYPFLILFVAGMIGVVCVSDLFFFFIFWEFMTLTSYMLVVYEKENPTVLKAGFKYFLMTHIATVFMFLAGIVLQSYSGSFSFTSMGAAFETIAKTKPFLLYIILTCFFLGFATKAGVYPFGSWLPDAHPAAPSGISAILSGIMIKMGIYGMLRVFLYILPVTSHSSVWGIIIATFGTLSILIGTFSALIQKDAKRLLAFHSIGQIGYVLLAIGIGLSFVKDYPIMAMVAIVAGLFHMINHAFFKSLLFLNAGSIIFKTGTRDLNKLSGLWTIMPFTTITAIIASMSISGFPPFNGFASKWLIYQVSILGGIKFSLYVLFGVVAIFVSAVTMASFLKFLSTAFMGDIMDDAKKAIKPGEVTVAMNISQNVLALICLALGLFPLLPMRLIYAALDHSMLSGVLTQPFSKLFGIGRNGVSLFMDDIASGIWRPLMVTIVFAGCLFLAYLIFKSAKAKKRAVPVWYCGEEYDKNQVRYKAHSFYLALQQVIERWLFPQVRLPSLGKLEGFYKALDFDRLFYYPLVKWIFGLTQTVRKTHVGIPQVYMLWLVIGIIIVVLSLFLFAR
jgi:hydrogenase-4 component B